MSSNLSSMATGGNPKQLLTLIRDVATEKSQGERRVVGLKNRIEELRSVSEITNAELEEAKRSKEFMEQEIKGFQVESSLNESSVHAIGSRICLIQDEVSKIQSEVEALKSEECAYRDEFINQMAAFNTTIREFQKSVTCSFHEERNTKLSSHNCTKVEDKQAAIDNQVVLRDLEDKLENIISQTHMEEQEYQENQGKHKKVQHELDDLARQVSLMEAVVKEMKELQGLTGQTAKLEEACRALGEKLQEICACPSCHVDNMGALEGPLEANQES